MPAQRSTSGLPTEEAVPGPQWQRLTDGGPDGALARRRPPSVRQVLARFVAANLGIALLLLAGSLWAGNSAARRESLADARTTTDLLAELLIEPNVSDGVLTGDPRALTALDGVVDGQLREAAVVRIKIWDADMQVVYSDDRRLIGRTFPLGEEKQDILRTGGVLAELTSLREEENVFERPQEERLLEVYRQIITPAGDRLLLETYFDYRQVTRRQADIWLTFVPISVAVLLAMLLVQLPLAKRMIRQVREGDAERLRLHARAADASDDERRRIAGSLHDGVVQDLSAAPYLMSGAVDLLTDRPGSDTAAQDAAHGLGLAMTAVRQSVAALRSLLIEIYPPHLARAGLPAALADLAARAQARGVATQLDVPDDLDLPADVDALLFRVAQEALRKVAKHARAGTVQLTLRRDRQLVTMEVRDDGAGFDPSTTSGDTGIGHFGMRVLTDLSEAAGATLDLASAPGQGTALRLQVPLQT
jgi:two-component system, NarL family, sensor kinase